MAKRAIAEDKRIISVVAEDDTDVPDALRLIAKELEKGNGELLSIDLQVQRYDGTEQLAAPELDENGEEIAPPMSSGVQPKRLDIRVSAEIRSEIAQ